MSQLSTEDLIRACYESLNFTKGGSHFDEWWHKDSEFINAGEDLDDHASHPGVGAIRAHAQTWFHAFPICASSPWRSARTEIGCLSGPTSLATALTAGSPWR